METLKPWSKEKLIGISQQRLMLMENIASLELQIVAKRKQLALFDDEIAANLPYGRTETALDLLPTPRVPLMSEVVRHVTDRIKEAAQFPGLRQTG